jgi:hypothetical protein
MTIERREKIGLGIWDEDNRGSALNAVDRLGFDWYYNWSERPMWDSDATPEQTSWTPMLWDETDVTATALQRVRDSGATTLLGFNEPNHAGQADLSVKQALDLWARLQTLDVRLGSPAATPGGTLGEDSWLGRFMAGAEERGLRVDFVAVHYYSKDGDVAKFKAFLEAVHEQYGKPIWVTEWAMADWNDLDRFSPTQQADFARGAIEMLDDLPFVERHAWYSGYDKNFTSEVFNLDNTLTAVGRVFQELLDDTPDLCGTGGADVIAGAGAAEQIRGLGDGDRLAAGGGADQVDGGGGRDLVLGQGGSDRLWGRDGGDTLYGCVGSDSLYGGAGGDLLGGGSGNDQFTGGGGSDRFLFRQGQDRILDFQDDVDTIVFNSVLWGGGSRSVGSVLSLAHLSNGDAVFDFGNGNVLRVDDVGRLSALRDDIAFL